MDEDLVIGICEELEEDSKGAKAAIKLCTDFISSNSLQIQGSCPETKAKSATFRTRSQEASRNVEKVVAKTVARKRKATAKKEAEERRLAAIKAAEKQEAMFKQYDADKDGKLNQ